MPYANNKYTADGSTATFSVAFPYLSEGDLVVSVDGVVKTLTTDYTVPSTSQITFNTPPANGTVVELKRSSNQSARLVDYTAGAIFKESDLDTDGLQTFYMAQEAIDSTEDALRVNSINKYNAGARVITNLADPVDLTDAVSLGFISPNLTNIGTVAGISGDVTTVAGNSADISSVAANASNINAVQANSANINSAVSNASNINNCAANSNAISAVAINQSNIVTVAGSIADVNKYVDTYSTGGTAPSSPTVGDLWFDTTVQVLKVYTSGGWQHASSAISTSSTRLSYTVGTNSGTYTSGSLTTFPVTYDSGFIDVYLNGVKLINVTDFTATNGTEVVLGTAATAGDVVDFVAYGNQVLTDVSAISPHIANINLVGNDISNVTTTATNISNVNAVGGNIANVNTVASDSTNIGTVAANVHDVRTIANDISNVNAVGGDITNVNTVAGDATNIGIVATNISDINALGPQATNIASVGANITSINAVYSDLNNIGIVATDIANVNAVGASIANVNTVAGDSSNISTVATNISDVNTVATNMTDVTAVAADASDIGTVANNMSDVTTVAGDVNDIGTVAANVNHIYVNSNNINYISTVAGNASNISTVATHTGNITSVSSHISSINTVAANISDINSIANPDPFKVYHRYELIGHSPFNNGSVINSEWVATGTISNYYSSVQFGSYSSIVRSVVVTPGKRYSIWLDRFSGASLLSVGTTSGGGQLINGVSSSDSWYHFEVPSNTSVIYVKLQNSTSSANVRVSWMGMYDLELENGYDLEAAFYASSSSLQLFADDDDYAVATKTDGTHYIKPTAGASTGFRLNYFYPQVTLFARKPS